MFILYVYFFLNTEKYVLFFFEVFGLLILFLLCLIIVIGKILVYFVGLRDKKYRELKGVNI